MGTIYLFGYLEDDFLGRLMMASDELSVGQLAEQLSAWSYERGLPIAVTNEAGDTLDLEASIRSVGLGDGDMFTVRRDV